MKPILLVDTETTDSGEDARLIQFASKNLQTGEITNELFKPPGPINIEAMAVHHITEEAIANRIAFIESELKEKVQDLLKTHVLVAHRAPFEIRILQNEGVQTFDYIDTLRVARHLLASERNDLQYLRYSLRLQVNAIAHDALGDVLVLEALFNHLKELITKRIQPESDEEVLNMMRFLTHKPVKLEKVPFGRYRKEPINKIAQEDPEYLEKMLKNEQEKPDHDQHKDLIYTLEELDLESQKIKIINGPTTHSLKQAYFDISSYHQERYEICFGFENGDSGFLTVDRLMRDPENFYLLKIEGFESRKKEGARKYSASYNVKTKMGSFRWESAF